MLPTLWEQFGDGPFLFQRDCAPVHKDQCAGLSGSSTPNSESHLNPAEALWDELAETVSRTFSSIVSVWPSGTTVKDSHKHTRSAESAQKGWSC